MIPDYLISAYENIPNDRPVSVLMRHSIRYPITTDEEIYTAGLTYQGFELAKAVGRWISNTYDFGLFFSSPIGRCVDTGKMIAAGAKKERPIEEIYLMGHPNEQGEYDSISSSLKNGQWQERIHKMAAYLVPNGIHQDGLNFYFSHDTMIVLMAAYWLGIDLRGPADWPRYLEPFFFYWEKEDLTAVFRNQKYNIQETYQANKAQLIGLAN
jgi:broad specificity phosphatase PhoE